jgi:serine phosphatase RsbU (regulator of sigma subunit)
MLKIAFPAQAPNATDPARVLAGLNQALCGKFDRHFVTAAYLYFDTEQGTIDYAGAGHPPIVVYDRAKRSARALVQNGLFLGRFPAGKYSSMRIPFAAGDRCVVYTDGIPEAHNAAEEEFGLDGLQKIVEAEPDLASNAFADRVLESVARWTGRSSAENNDDDVTLVVIRSNPPSAG